MNRIVKLAQWDDKWFYVCLEPPGEREERI